MRILKSESSNLILYLSGQTVSTLMSAVYTFAAGLYVLKMTGSGLSFAVTLSLQIVPAVLLGPISGVLADRFSKKLLVVSADAFSGILFVLLFFLSAGGLTLSGLYLATLLLSAAQTLYSVAIDSAVPNIVSGSKVGFLNSAGKIVYAAASIGSPGLGGLLYALVDIRCFILLNGISFLLSTAAECLIDFRLYGNRTPRSQKFHWRQNLGEGFRYIRQTEWMKKTLVNFTVVNVFLSLCYSVPVPYLLNTRFGLSPKVYGLLQCFMPLGMMAGALLVKRLSSLVSYGKSMAATGFCFAVLLFLLGLFPAITARPSFYPIVFYYAPLLACSGFVLSLIDIPFIGNFQVLVPEEIRGRSMSISMSVIKTFTPLGYMIAGGLTGIVPAFLLPLLGGILLFVFYLLARRRLESVAF